MRHKKLFYILCQSPTTYCIYVVLLYFHFPPNKKLILSGCEWMGWGGGVGDSFTLISLKVTQALVIICAKNIFHTFYFTNYKMHCS
jgi:hypothetical protein